MNARNLNKQSATDWARIDRMTDEEIDTSDIPPLTDAFFAKAKWRLPRSYIYLKDFNQARRFAAYILERRLHERKKTEPARARQQLVHLAFNTSLIISYSRPFTGNYNFKGQDKSSLKGSEHDVLKAGVEVELHRRILDLRNRAYAHSEAGTNLIEGFDYSKYFALMPSVELLDKSETGTLKVIIERWISHLKVETSNLKESLKRRA
jgi:hypothetical protein